MAVGNEHFRIEKDFLGSVKISNNYYYGIHTVRAIQNFNVSNTKVNIGLIYAIVLVKKAAAITNKKLKLLSGEKAEAIEKTCEEILTGRFDDEFVTDAMQGGAGTSTNMNVNEVIANRAIEMLGGEKGQYEIVDPLDHVNLGQSTNDVYPTALRIAAIKKLRPLSEELASLQESLQEKENEFANILKLGRTQLMDALPMTVGQGFGAYAKAIARDRWRIYKVEERLRQINLGGTAIGTGMNASLKYIYMITDMIQELTGYGLARSDYPMDITQNADVFVEVSALIKSASVNLFKIASDLRLLSSGPTGGFGELSLPYAQAGSSIMPGKVNPVIPEMINQISMKIMANDLAITMAASNGQLELNAFMPLIATSLLESIEIMTRAIVIFKEKCIQGIQVNEENCKQNLLYSASLATALTHYIGYEKAANIAKKANKENKTIKEIVLEEKILSQEQVEKILNPHQIINPGIPGL